MLEIFARFEAALVSYWPILASSGAAIAAISAFVSQVLQTRKLRLEIKKLKTQAEADSRVVKIATLEEVIQYGKQSSRRQVLYFAALSMFAPAAWLLIPEKRQDAGSSTLVDLDDLFRRWSLAVINADKLQDPSDWSDTDPRWTMSYVAPDSTLSQFARTPGEALELITLRRRLGTEIYGRLVFDRTYYQGEFGPRREISLADRLMTRVVAFEGVQRNEVLFRVSFVFGSPDGHWRFLGWYATETF